MDIDTVRDRATAFCDALDAGNVEAATEHMSPELRRNLGEVLALLPLPTNESTVQSVDHVGSGYNVVLLLRGVAGLFLRDRSSASNVAHMVATQTLTPRSRSIHSTSSARVASGWAAT